MELARVMRRRTVREGEILWRQGDDAREMRVHRRRRRLGVAAPARGSHRGDREGRSGEVVGEIGLLDGEGHTMSVRVTETATVLALGRLDFAALLAGQHPSAFRLKRRLASLFTARLRNQLAAPCRLARRRDGRPAGRRTPHGRSPTWSACGPPDSKYVRRMATFHDFDPLALWGFLTSGTLCPVPAGPDAARRRGAVDGLLPDDQRRGREGAGSRRPAHPRRAGGAGEGVRLREPHRRRPVSRHRDHARAGAPARPAARPVRAALQRRGRRLPRLPRRDPAGPDGHVARDAAPSTLASRRAFESVWRTACPTARSADSGGRLVSIPDVEDVRCALLVAAAVGAIRLDEAVALVEPLRPCLTRTSKA